MSETREQVAARLLLGSCAHQFSVACQYDPEDRAAHERWRAAQEALLWSALRYAGSRGDLTADERADLAVLRRFRDGVTALRKEVADGNACTGEAMTPTMVLETIDALLKFDGGKR